MAKTATITLGGEQYTVRSLTLEELEEITDLVAEAGDDKVKVGKISFKVLKIALRRASPKPPDQIEASLTEVREANAKILVLAGMMDPEPDPPQGQETAAA